MHCLHTIHRTAWGLMWSGNSLLSLQTRTLEHQDETRSSSILGRNVVFMYIPDNLCCYLHRPRLQCWNFQPVVIEENPFQNISFDPFCLWNGMFKHVWKHGLYIIDMLWWVTCYVAEARDWSCDLSRDKTCDLYHRTSWYTTKHV